jgi:hypothetical protein
MTAIGIALAKTYGPFSIAPFSVARGSPGTWALDNNGAYSEAQAFFLNVLQFHQPRKMVPSDKVRILYADGVYAEFMLSPAGAMCMFGTCTWGGTMPMVFVKTLANPTEPTSYEGSGGCYGYAYGGSTYSPAGFWGESVEVYPDGGVVVTASWVETGMVQLKSTSMKCI